MAQVGFVKGKHGNVNRIENDCLVFGVVPSKERCQHVTGYNCTVSRLCMLLKVANYSINSN